MNTGNIQPSEANFLYVLKTFRISVCLSELNE